MAEAWDSNVRQYSARMSEGELVKAWMCGWSDKWWLIEVSSDCSDGVAIVVLGLNRLILVVGCSLFGDYSERYVRM